MAPSKIASAPSCLPLAAWLRVNLSADVFQLGNKPCPRIASTHRERGLRTRHALRCDRRLPSSKRAVSNFAIVVYSVFMHVEVDLH
jgi:hypothetical protein